ncbi:unnamed protein product [Closterium sp. Yama58-4]|nr:unnamed protein product [Closterium sp. Yama58-4]
MLRLSAERYWAEMKLFACARVNMIRVWAGALMERPEFYDACDRLGILVWQEFWITGDCNGRGLPPSDPSWPLDHRLFLACAEDSIRLLRNHASLALWVGGNETMPAPDLNDSLKSMLRLYDGACGGVGWCGVGGVWGGVGGVWGGVGWCMGWCGVVWGGVWGVGWCEVVYGVVYGVVWGGVWGGVRVYGMVWGGVWDGVGWCEVVYGVIGGGSLADEPSFPIRPSFPATSDPDPSLLLDGTRAYIEGSLWGGFADSKGGWTDGPYGIQNPEDFFCPDYYPYAFNPEIGSVGVPEAESLREFFPESDWSPPVFGRAWEECGGECVEEESDGWKVHTYIPYSMVGAEPKGGGEMANYLQYRSLFEAWGARMWERYTGVLLWKGQNPWGGLRGQLYDHLLAPTGGLYGVRCALEPVHVQLDLHSGKVQLQNRTQSRALEGLRGQLYDHLLAPTGGLYGVRCALKAFYVQLDLHSGRVQEPVYVHLDDTRTFPSISLCSVPSPVYAHQVVKTTPCTLSSLSHPSFTAHTLPSSHCFPPLPRPFPLSPVPSPSPPSLPPPPSPVPSPSPPSLPPLPRPFPLSPSCAHQVVNTTARALSSLAVEASIHLPTALVTRVGPRHSLARDSVLPLVMRFPSSRAFPLVAHAPSRHTRFRSMRALLPLSRAFPLVTRTPSLVTSSIIQSQSIVLFLTCFPPPSSLLPLPLLPASPLPPPCFPPPWALLPPSIPPASPLLPLLPPPCWPPPWALLPPSLRPASPLPPPCFPPLSALLPPSIPPASPLPRPCCPPPSALLPPPSALLPPSFCHAPLIPPPCFPPPSTLLPPSLRPASPSLYPASPLPPPCFPPSLRPASPLPPPCFPPPCALLPPSLLPPSLPLLPPVLRPAFPPPCALLPPSLRPASPLPPPCFPPPSALLPPSLRPISPHPHRGERHAPGAFSSRALSARRAISSPRHARFPSATPIEKRLSLSPTPTHVAINTIVCSNSPIRPRSFQPQQLLPY